MKMVIAGGGTGGHLFPALALAEALTARGGEVLLLGSGRYIEKLAVANGPYPVRFLAAEGVMGKRLGGKLKALVKLLRATGQALKILRAFNPQVVFGVGGYASFPALLAAKILRLKTAFHEQNLIPGRANLVLSRLVDRIFITFPQTARYFPASKVIHSGMPVRAEVVKKYPRIHEGLGLLVTGGSQGARFINHLFIRLAPELAKLPGLFLLHQTGEVDFEEVKKAYETSGLKAQVYPFIKKMGWAYAQADLVVCRAGAATVAELCRLKKPAILIPYPYAIRDHQAENARFLVEAGAALMFREEEIEPQTFRETLLSLLRNEAKRREMAQKLEKLLPEEALQIILTETEAMVAHA